LVRPIAKLATQARIPFALRVAPASLMAEIAAAALAQGRLVAEPKREKLVPQRRSRHTRILSCIEQIDAASLASS
jgi:hypothetical protein